MSDSILGGDFTIYYEAENRQKRIHWDGSATGTRTSNELYSALQDLFDELNQMDDGTPMSAQTPTEYTIGIIDAGDDDPWFIDKDTVEHITGGAIKTASWSRVEGSNTGIVRVDVTANNISENQIGQDITHGDGDTGTLLDTNTNYLWIRPDTSAIGNSFDNTTGTITCSGLTATQSASAESGESLWANIYSIGTIETNTHLYIYQDGSLLTAYKDTTDWWSDGHVDLLVNVKEVDTEVDEGVITVLGRQYSKTFDNFIVDLTAGGRNPIPLATADDLDNTTGYRQMVLSDATGDFTLDEIIQDSNDANIKGVVTANTGTAPNITLEYYLIGDPLDDFTGATGQLEGLTSGVSATGVAPSNVGPADAALGVTVTHGVDETFDIDENGSTENYSIVIDCNNKPLADVYEFVKYTSRRGETGTSTTDGVEGEQYIGSDYKIAYVTPTGTINEGDVVTQDNSGATGTVVAHNTTDDYLILRNSRGTFNDADIVRVDGSNYVATPTSSVISPVKASPFGTFAGGKFFCAFGVVLDNVPGSDLNNFQLIDDDGNVVLAPIKVTVTIGNTRSADKIAVFRLTAVGGIIEKDTYTCTGQAIAATSLIVQEAIDPEEPGKTTGGIAKIVDASGQQEYRLRYSSWATSTFTLAYSDIANADAATSTTIQESGAFATSKVGDLVLNVSQGNVVSYIKTITDSSNVIIEPAIDGQTTGDNIKLNALPIATENGVDTTYIPFIDVYETTGTDGSPGTEEATVTYSIDIPVRIRARQAGDILPYEADALIGSTGLSNNIIRTDDTIFT